MESEMNTTKRTRAFVASVLAAGVLIPAAPAAASVYGPLGPQENTGQQSGTPKQQSAEPSGGVVLRRDGSQAETFVASVGTPTGTSSDSFDWGDAAIGAGVGIAGVLMAGAGSTALRRRRSQPMDHTSAAPHGA
jgi:hypothetical protein